MFILSDKVERLEDERQLDSGTGLVDFKRIDAIFARFEMARLDAQPLDFDIPNFQILTTILFRALQIGPVRAPQMLQPLNRQMRRERRSSTMLYWIA